MVLGASFTALERTARQMVILDDRSLLDAYAANRRQFAQAVAESLGVVTRIEAGRIILSPT